MTEEWYETMRWWWLICLSFMAWEDLKNREIPLGWMMAGLIPGIGNVMMTGIREHMMAAAVGVLMLGVSKLTDGALGVGDGLFFLLSACYFDIKGLFLLFLGSLTAGGVWAMVLILRRQWSGGTGKMGTIPFLACVWPVGVWLIW